MPRRNRKGYETVMGYYWEGDKNEEGGMLLDICLRNGWLLTMYGMRKEKAISI